MTHRTIALRIAGRTERLPVQLVPMPGYDMHMLWTAIARAWRQRHEPFATLHGVSLGRN